MEHRPRNGFGKPVLDSLNPQRFTSQIPQPSQGKRRNTTNMGLTDMINKSIAKNAPVPPQKRSRSTVTGDDSAANFRLSQRYSSLPFSANNTGRTSMTSTTSVSNRDPRPLRDRNYQNAIQQEICDYLTFNRFDVETGHPISLKFLKQPTQKGFMIIFKWLYMRLDPGYKFTRSVENEVYQILRTLQYPYLETINKSQISAVGGSSWPKFLGMLYWLVKINAKLDKSLNELDQTLINQNTQDVTILNQPLTTLDEQDQKQEKYELMVEKLFIEYVMDSYKSFLRLEDNYDPYMIQLEIGFEKFVRIIETDINQLQLQNDKIYMQCQDVAQRGKQLKIAREKCKALKSDLVKFQSYVDGMNHKSQEWPRKLEKMASESLAKKEQISKFELEIKDLQNGLEQRGISMDNIDEKNKQKEELAKTLDYTLDRQDQLTSVIKADKFEIEGVWRRLMETLKQYNNAIDSLINARTKSNDTIDDAELRVTIPADINWIDAVAITYAELFGPNYSITETVGANLSQINNKILSKIERAQNDNNTLEMEISDLRDQISEKTRAIERLELELSDVKSKYKLGKQENESHLLSQKIELEKLERKINDSNKLLQEKISTAQQLVQATKLKFEEQQLDINRQRASLHRQIIEIIEFASNFKINIQGLIEQTENRINQEAATLDAD
ncbi:hypothetical protein ZYGR_0AD03680 [Zygosaccharomyces rouxii]|uniref:Kinetochore protein NDC80 n=2 Tax=Zygosaccharomyces rouxii TaxID=4956 RepID=C5E0Q0_ZYGRC|nr:uncharacterized protein ZYRO0G14652g [Zygosaccharomyces rouxii]KAH9202678.1 HEC/Ndc80p family-domain-containing protein [Zygosaccharomyces rouxii]GAV51185.1 hypothetical protein ZYGR_0AD03680 [Zygosaccharomyces rouxii]CAR29684.1 ZYRO0G14652p [Zygosaccharomyces rouxii]